MKKKHLAIIIPCFNCEKTIQNIITSCLSYTPIVIVVDDGSFDKSISKIKNTQAILINNQVNKGVGFATNIGIKKAISLGANLFVTLDADGAHNPHNIPKIVEHHQKSNSDLTIGDRWRFVENTLYYPSSKIWANKFASSLVNKILGTNYFDVSCGFRVLNLHAFNLLNQINSSGYGYIYQSIFKLQNKGIISSFAVDCLYNAEELFFTRTEELNGLITSSMDFLKTDSPLFVVLTKIKKNIHEHKKVHINLMGDKIIAFPLKNIDGYIFQYQNSIFIDPEDYLTI